MKGYVQSSARGPYHLSAADVADADGVWLAGNLRDGVVAVCGVLVIGEGMGWMPTTDAGRHWIMQKDHGSFCELCEDPPPPDPATPWGRALAKARAGG